MAKSTSILVKNKKPVYGTVDLSPDSDLAMLGISNCLMARSEVRVTNLPRSVLFLTYLNTLEGLGFILNWENYNDLRIKFKDVSSIQSNIPGGIFNSNSIHILSFIIPLLLKIKGSITVDASYDQFVDEKFLENLDVEVVKDKSKIFISLPIDTPREVTLKYEMESVDAAFLFNKILMKNIFPKLHIILPDHHIINSANVLLDETKGNDTLVCPPSISEFKFFCSLLNLLDGEIEFKGYDLKFFLSHLLRFVDLGTFYEVVDNKLRVWIESKELSLEYLYKDIGTQDLALLLLLETTKSKHNIRNIIPYKKHFELLIKELNISGCRIDYKTYIKNDSSYMDILVKPSVINSTKINMLDESLAINLSIMLPAFCSENRGRVESVNIVEFGLANFRDNISNINLDLEISGR